MNGMSSWMWKRRILHVLDLCKTNSSYATLPGKKLKEEWNCTTLLSRDFQAPVPIVTTFKSQMATSNQSIRGKPQQFETKSTAISKAGMYGYLKIKTLYAIRLDLASSCIFQYFCTIGTEIIEGHYFYHYLAISWLAPSNVNMSECYQIQRHNERNFCWRVHLRVNIILKKYFKIPPIWAIKCRTETVVRWIVFRRILGKKSAVWSVNFL